MYVLRSKWSLSRYVSCQRSKFYIYYKPVHNLGTLQTCGYRPKVEEGDVPPSEKPPRTCPANPKKICKCGGEPGNLIMSTNTL